MPKATIQSATYWLNGEPLCYRLVRSYQRFKTITLDYKPNYGISLAVPSDMTDREIGEFLRSKEDWLRKCRSVMSNASQLPDWGKGEVIPFRGKDVLVVVAHNADLRRHDGILVQPSIDGGELSVSVPDGLESAQRDRGIASAIEQWYVSEAKLHLPVRLAQWSELTGLHPERVRIGKAMSRWGSCSAQRYINLSWRLIKLPERLSDYVLVHELVHLRELNHQRPFWDLFESIMPDARVRRKELREASRMSVG